MEKKKEASPCEPASSHNLGENHARIQERGSLILIWVNDVPN